MQYRIFYLLFSLSLSCTLTDGGLTREKGVARGDGGMDGDIGDFSELWPGEDGGIHIGQTQSEICNGSDDDGDGTIDETLVPPSCDLRLGVCENSSRVCGGTLGWLQCGGTKSYGAGYVEEEDGKADEALCDDADNDCDGSMDEGCPSAMAILDATDLRLPSLHDQHLAFLAKKNEQWDVFFADLRSGELLRITDTPEDEDTPDVYGNLVAFTRGRGAAARVVLFDVEAKMEVFVAATPSVHPRVFRSWVVWEDGRSGEGSDIYGYDLRAQHEVPFAVSTANEFEPDIRGSTLVYSADRSGIFSIHVRNLEDSKERVYEPTLGHGLFGARTDFTGLGWNDTPLVSATMAPTKGRDVLGAALDGSTGIEPILGPAGASELLSDVDGGFFVASTNENGKWSVFVSRLTAEPSLITGGHTAQVSPSISGDLVVWEGLSKGSPAIVGTHLSGIPRPADERPVRINELLADPPTDEDINGDLRSSATEDEFVEIVNASDVPLDIGGVRLRDTTQVRHVFSEGTVIPSRGVILVFGGGNPVGRFGSGKVLTASSGSLGLNNQRDTLALEDVNGAMLDSVAYGPEAGHDESLVRAPEYQGPFVPHRKARGAQMRRFSPGTLADGFAF